MASITTTAGSPFARGFDPDAPPADVVIEAKDPTFNDVPGGDAVPEPMGVADVGSLANGLGLEAGPRAVLEQLHEDYLTRWDAEVGPIGAVENSPRRGAARRAAGHSSRPRSRRRVRRVARSRPRSFAAAVRLPPQWASVSRTSVVSSRSTARRWRSGSGRSPNARRAAAD